MGTAQKLRVLPRCGARPLDRLHLRATSRASGRHQPLQRPRSFNALAAHWPATSSAPLFTHPLPFGRYKCLLRPVQRPSYTLFSRSINSFLFHVLFFIFFPGFFLEFFLMFLFLWYSFFLSLIFS